MEVLSRKAGTHSGLILESKPIELGKEVGKLALMVDWPRRSVYVERCEIDIFCSVVSTYNGGVALLRLTRQFHLMSRNVESYGDVPTGYSSSRFSTSWPWHR